MVVVDLVLNPVILMVLTAKMENLISGKMKLGNLIYRDKSAIKSTRMVQHTKSEILTEILS